MNRTLRHVLAVTAAVAVTLGGVLPAEAGTPICVPVRPQQHPVIGGQEINVDVHAEACGASLTVLEVYAATTSGRPFTVTADLYRYRYDGSRGGLKSGRIGSSGPAYAHLLRTRRPIPHRQRGHGWDGYVLVRLTVGREVRTIAVML